MATATPTTNPNESVIAVTPTSVSHGSMAKVPNIKRHIQLYRYGKVGLLGKKGWKESNVIIYDDSTLKIFKDAEGHKTSIRPIVLEDVILDIAFGKGAFKYGPPHIIGDERNFVDSNYFIAIPETKERNKVHWFAAKDGPSLHEIMHVIAEAVAGKVRPPQMGKGPKGRYATHDEHDRWVAYWNSQQNGSELHEENGTTTGATVTNGESGGVSITHPIAKPVAVPSPPPQTSKQGKISPPTVNLVQMPTSVESLRWQHDNLQEDNESNLVPVVRLVNGKRIKEEVIRRQQPPTQTSFPVHHHKLTETYDTKPIITTTNYGYNPTCTPITNIEKTPASTINKPSPTSILKNRNEEYKSTYQTNTSDQYSGTGRYQTPGSTFGKTSPIIIKTSLSPSPTPIRHESGYQTSSTVNEKYSSHTSSPQQSRSPYTSSPSSTTTRSTYNSPSRSPYGTSPYKTEIRTYLAGEPPREKTTTNISILAEPVKEHFSQSQEREEVVTDNQKTIINVGQSERSLSTVENTDNGVTYKSTKQTSYHKSTVTTSNE